MSFESIGGDVTQVIIFEFCGPITATRFKRTCKFFSHVIAEALDRSLRSEYPNTGLLFPRLRVGTFYCMVSYNRDIPMLEYKACAHVMPYQGFTPCCRFVQFIEKWFAHPDENVAVSFIDETRSGEGSDWYLVMFLSPVCKTYACLMRYSHTLRISNSIVRGPISCGDVWPAVGDHYEHLQCSPGAHAIKVLGSNVDIDDLPYSSITAAILNAFDSQPPNLFECMSPSNRNNGWEESIRWREAIRKRRIRVWDAADYLQFVDVVFTRESIFLGFS